MYCHHNVKLKNEKPLEKLYTTDFKNHDHNINDKH